MLNFTTFADAKSFYQFWDIQDHKTHSKFDFAFRAICVSIFNEETEEQCIERLKRTMPTSKQGPRYKTLCGTLTNMLWHYGYWQGGTFSKKIADKEARNDQGLIREQAKVLLDRLASKIAASASQETGAANDAG